MYSQNFIYLLEYYNYDYHKCFLSILITFIICIILFLIDKFIEETKAKK